MLLLCDRFSVIEAGGHAIACRPPTLETVEVFMARFDRLVAEVVKEMKAGPLSVEVMGHLVAVFESKPDDFAACLATCCSVVGSTDRAMSYLALRAQRETRLKCALEVMALCNLDAIAASFRASSAGRARGSADENSTTKMVCMLAERFGVSPLEVVRWPYDTVTEITSALAEIAAASRAASQFQRDGSRTYGPPIDLLNLSRDELRGLGVTVFAAGDA